MFVSQNKVEALAEELAERFHFDLHSQMTVGQVAKVAMEMLEDEGLPQRKSLALAIAKIAQALFAGQIIHTKREI